MLKSLISSFHLSLQFFFCSLSHLIPYVSLTQSVTASLKRIHSSSAKSHLTSLPILHFPLSYPIRLFDMFLCNSLTLIYSLTISLHTLCTHCRSSKLSCFYVSFCFPSVLLFFSFHSILLLFPLPLQDLIYFTEKNVYS